PNIANPGQEDSDGNGIGDACDVLPPLDSDGDGIADSLDNCPNIANPGQEDSDGNGIGDACDVLPPLDSDGDGIADSLDNCPNVANPGQEDSDGNGIGDVCDITEPYGFKVISATEIQFFAEASNFSDLHYRVNNGAQLNVRMIDDGQGRKTYNISGSAGDTITGSMTVANPLAFDTEFFQYTFIDGPSDVDGDGVIDSLDNCPTIANPGQEDANGNGVGDACEAGTLDQDGDGWADVNDNCPVIANPGQEDSNNNGIGDACEPDTGGTGVTRTANGGLLFHIAPGATNAIVHYQLNNQAQQNLMMTVVNGNFQWEIAGLEAGDQVRYSFTIFNPLAMDTANEVFVY
ncbi:MAG: hypothetical protein ACI93R_001891, partial [Flavobacteriales bacterium]